MGTKLDFLEPQKSCTGRSKLSTCCYDLDNDLSATVNLNATCYDFVNTYHDLDETTRDDICYSLVASDILVAMLCPVSCGICPQCTAPPSKVTTEFPTTASPTTESPSTSNPTTNFPTTRTPTTESPTTSAPVVFPTDPPSFEPTRYYLNDTCCYDVDSDQCFSF